MSHQPNFSNSEIAFAGKSNADLNRAYWLFKAISSNLLVKIGPPLTIPDDALIEGIEIISESIQEVYND